MLHPITNGTFTLDDVTVIRQAFFKEGSFLISITNSSQIASQVHMRINELFYRANGENYRVDRSIQGGETYVHPVSMPPLYIETPGTGTGTHLHYSVDVEIFDSQDVKKQVSKNDVMITQLQPDRPLIAERVDGRFEPMAQDIDSGFESDSNQVQIISRDGQVEDLPLMSKDALADQILDRIVMLRKKAK